MTWKEQLVNSKFSITTGDKEIYYPLWQPDGKSWDFNVSEFDFIEEEATLVVRKERKSYKVPLIFWFQGADVLIQSEKFEESSKDSRYWIINHPYYGEIKGQPLSISRDDKSYGIVGYSIDFWETITEKGPINIISLKDTIYTRSVGIKTSSSKIYASKITTSSSAIPTAKSNVNKSVSFIDKLAELKEVGQDKFSEFQQTKNKALSGLDKILEEPIRVISDVNDLMFSPSEFLVGVELRLSLYKAVFSQLKEVLFINEDKSNKAYFESVGAFILSSVCNTLVNPIDGDYNTRVNIFTAAETLETMYLEYVGLLDEVSVGFEDFVNPFYPSGDLMNDLLGMVLETISELSTLAFDAKQERTVILTEDTNLILLVHKYVGLDEEDLNLENFRITNNIKNRKLFKVSKGTTIKYLV